MVDPKKVANNILDFLIDPTVIPVQQRVYFRPEEILRNETYESAKADAKAAYGEQRQNSDFYPSQHRKIKREASTMDRKSIIASFDILSKNFSENDPIATDLRTMALAVSKMSDEEFGKRQASDAPDFEGTSVEAAKTFKCPTCGTKVLEQTKYCVKCKKKVQPPKSAAEPEEKPEEEAPKGKKEEAPVKPEAKPEEEEVLAEDFRDDWSKEASDRVARAIVSDIIGLTADDIAEEMPEEEKAEEKVEKKPEEKKAEKEEKEEAVKEAPAKEVPPVKEAGKKKEEEPMEEEAVKVKEAAKEEKKEEVVAPVEEKKVPEEGKESQVVNTDILASITFGDIEVPMGIVSSDDIGEMSAEEKERLAKLF